MILRCLSSILLLLITFCPAHAAPRQLTVFSDGSLLELELVAKNGLAEVSLPYQLREGTLRIKPLDNSSIERVEVAPYRMPDKLQKELNGLVEQKSRLEDRLKALDTKEGIFEAAAKSQSSKAPRKTKTNPDPLASVRQGTDFAIAQLEAVFTARRRTEQELHKVTTRIAQLTKANAGPTVKVLLSPAASNRIRLAAVLNDNGWKATYELRLNGDGTARLVQLATIATAPAGFSIAVTPSALADGLPQRTIPYTPGRAARLAQWQLPLSQEQITIGPLPNFNISLLNSTGMLLPAGEVAVYSHGEYLGSVTCAATPNNGHLTVTNRTP